MTPYQIAEKAKEFSIPYKKAAVMRMRYLEQQLEQGLEWVFLKNDMPTMMPDECTRQLLALSASLKVSPNTTITPEMVEQARGADIASMLNLVRGKCLAWCHDDKSPSLTYMSKTRQMWCPVCDEWFDAIDIQRHLTGQSFTEAVRSLCR